MHPYCCSIVWFTVSLLVKVHLTADEIDAPHVVVCSLVRNKAPILPYFLGNLENLDYPKYRITLWIRSDHNIDNTVDILLKWTEDVLSFYKSINFVSDDSETSHESESTPFDWPRARHSKVAGLREECLAFSKEQNADAVFMLDADVFLTNPNTVRFLVSQKDHVVVAPHVISPTGFTNYWVKMSDSGRFLDPDPDFRRQLDLRTKVGCFEVQHVHTAFLINLRHRDAKYLTFDSTLLPGYTWFEADSLALSFSAIVSDVTFHFCNQFEFGRCLDRVNASIEDDLAFEQDAMTSLVLDTTRDGLPGLLHSPYVYPPMPTYKDKLEFDEIYVINLKRRVSRRERMNVQFSMLGMDVRFVDAEDGRLIDDKYLEDHKIQFLPGYRDPHFDRPMTKGEIGCFMSHFKIWQDILSNGYERVVVFEDDLRFETFFRRRMQKLMLELDNGALEWDLMYLGRKRLSAEYEGPWVDNMFYVAHVPYSYWTLGYVITRRGAQKLIDSDPLSKLVPVDEFLPIMYDKHSSGEWSKYYSPRNLLAYTAEPLLVEPTHYTGDNYYITDTEDSSLALEVPKTEEHFKVPEEELLPEMVEVPEATMPISWKDEL